MTRDEIIAKYKQYLFPSVSTYFTDPQVPDPALAPGLRVEDSQRRIRPKRAF